MGRATWTTGLSRFASAISRTLTTLRLGLATVTGTCTTRIAIGGGTTGPLTLALTLRTRRTALLARIAGLFAQRRADTTGDIVQGLAGGFETGHLLAGDVLLGQTLDRLDKLPFIGSNQEMA